MSRNLLPSAIDYLEQADSTRIAHLIKLELVNSVFLYLTDYQSEVLFEQVYTPGKVLKVGSVRQTQGITNYKLSMDIAGEFQEELARGLVDNVSNSYVGRKLEVQRAYLDNAGEILPFDITTNGPMQYFIGEITDINISESIVSGSSTVTWQCAGKFQDFELVNGRITDDASHRGLVTSNDGAFIPSDGAKRVEHKTDTGFQHANQTIDIVTNYTSTETRFKIKSSWLGFRTSTTEYEVQVENTLELGLDLSAKYIPKVYGVRKVAGIPIFISPLISDPRTVYVVYAFAEGEIEAFLNLYIQGAPVICSSSSDANQNVCLGNQANNDTLSYFKNASNASSWSNLLNGVFNRPSFDNRFNEYEPPIDILVPSEIGRANYTGTVDREEFNITSEKNGVAWVQVFHGAPDQAACEKLVTNAASKNFSLQQGWIDKTYADFVGPKSPAQEGAYWDANSKLLDTAYVVMQVGITEDNQTIPELEAVISGTMVDTYDTVDNGTVPIPGLPPMYKSVDKSVSINPVWQILDYSTDSLCGGNLDITEVDINSFYDVASKLDAVTTSYEDEFVTYSRYLGWKDPKGTNTETIDSVVHDKQKTTMQTNVAFRTETPVTKNIKNLLDQFDGTVNILGGRYHLSIENNDAAIAAIEVGDIKGGITTKDLSNKNKWNSIQASIQDPTQNWGTTQISFFNSNYLALDKGIKKKGTVVFNYLTNYYTAREWAQKQLSRSRYSREITFTTHQKYLGLYPNANVTFTYERFNYLNKVFRVVSTTINSDGTMSVTLQDFDETEFLPEGAAPTNSEYSAGTSITKPEGLEFVYLPSPRFPATSIPDVYGLLIWNPVEGNSVLRYNVSDWLVPRDEEYEVTTDTLIEDSGGTLYHYYPITGLEANTDYQFKVRSLSQEGNSSLYSIYPLSINALPDPSEFSVVTGFKAFNDNFNNEYIGNSVILNWDTHLYSGVTYEIQFWNNDNPSTLISSKTTSSTGYTYDIDTNIADYASNNSGQVGAYRGIRCRIRVTNNITISDWTNLQ